MKMAFCKAFIIISGLEVHSNNFSKVVYEKHVNSDLYVRACIYLPKLMGSKQHHVTRV